MIKCSNCDNTAQPRYVVYIHARHCPEGFLHKGFIGDTKYPIFSTEDEAWKYINAQSLGWRWDGYCTVREYKGEFEDD